jgi:demethylsterigmatocystin 6-O-methyltransferase
VSQLTALASGADEATRKSMLTKLRDLSYTLESPDDTTIRIWGGVGEATGVSKLV